MMAPLPCGLAIHATSSQLGLALGNRAELVRAQTWDLGRDLSASLHYHLAALLAPQTWSDLAWLAVARGPGSFTSTRISLVTARTLAQQLDCPLFALSSLATYAWSQRTSLRDAARSRLSPEQPLAVLLPAQRGQLFVAGYQLQTEPEGLLTLYPEQALTPAAWQEQRATWPPETLELRAPEALGFTAPALLDLAARAYQAGDRPPWFRALPFYGQHPVTNHPG